MVSGQHLVLTPKSGAASNDSTTQLSELDEFWISAEPSREPAESSFDVVVASLSRRGKSSSSSSSSIEG